MTGDPETRRKGGVPTRDSGRMRGGGIIEMEGITENGEVINKGDKIQRQRVVNKR